MANYPAIRMHVGATEPVPRRIRAMLGGETILDTNRARYVWEIPAFPHYYIPPADINPECLIDEGHTASLQRGEAKRYGLSAGEVSRPGTVYIYNDDADEAVAGLARVEWNAVDDWLEEDERVFVHPRDPYTRVDALRATRDVRVEIDGVVLAEARSFVRLFETGLPPRHYLERGALNLDVLTSAPLATSCPYKGTTTTYWSAQINGALHENIAWSYDFPVQAVQQIAGLVAFYDEKVDTFLDGELLERPGTHFA